jgi:hypothetical protein
MSSKPKEEKVIKKENKPKPKEKKKVKALVVEN